MKAEILYGFELKNASITVGSTKNEAMQHIAKTTNEMIKSTGIVVLNFSL